MFSPFMELFFRGGERPAADSRPHTPQSPRRAERVSSTPGVFSLRGPSTGCIPTRTASAGSAKRSQRSLRYETRLPNPAMQRSLDNFLGRPMRRHDARLTVGKKGIDTINKTWDPKFLLTSKLARID
jgi:hypothetical protein